MPSALLRHLGNQPGQPVMQPAFPPSYRPDDVMIHTLSENAVGGPMKGQNAAPSSNTYPASSRVLAFPFELGDYFLVRKVFWCTGTTATTDSCDVGVYTESGATLLTSGGSTLIAGAATIQEKDCTDVLLAPGRYWCAYVQGGVTATPMAVNVTQIPAMRATGCAQMAGSGSTLGATFTPAACASGVFPIFGIASRTQIV